MAFRILLADDSMTAQNMGKKILTEAGYEVVAVSNGAAALKKLAEPFDLAILDIYMPGYTGLEVCEKARNAPETASMPVLLTVGKMEPFRPEEGAKAKADGVIVKPFEASDLIAAVKRYEQRAQAAEPSAVAESTVRVVPAVPAMEKTVVLTPEMVQSFKDASYEQWKAEVSVEMPVVAAEEQAAPANEQPYHAEPSMSSAPAFADLLDDHTPMASAPAAAMANSDEIFAVTPPAPATEPEPLPAFEVPALDAPAEAHIPQPAAQPAMEEPALKAFAAAMPIPEEPAAPVFEISAPVVYDAQPEVPVFEAAPLVESPTPELDAYEPIATLLDEEPSAMAAAPAWIEPTPEAEPVVVPEPASIAPEVVTFVPEAAPAWSVPAAPELEPTAAAQVGPVRAERDPAFEPTVLEHAPQLAHAGMDPALVTDPTEITQFATQFGTQDPEPVVVGIAQPEVEAEAEPEPIVVEQFARPESEPEPVVVEEAPAAIEEPKPTRWQDRLRAILGSEVQTEPSSVPSQVIAPMDVAAPAEAAVPEPIVEPTIQPIIEPAVELTEVAPVPDAALIAQEMHAAISQLEPEPIAPEAVADAPVVEVVQEEPVTVQAESAPDAELAAAMAAAVGGAAQAVHASQHEEGALSSAEVADIVTRVFERWKPDLIAEISREISRRK